MLPSGWSPAPHARLWFHTADRPLTADEQSQMLGDFEPFLSTWAAHGEALKAEAVILLDRILVVALDLDQVSATGCSIDSMLNFVRDHGGRSGIDWFDRHQVVYWDSGEVQAECIQLRTPEFWALRKAGRIQDDALVCDTLIPSASEWPTFVKPFSESWHAQMWN